MTLGNNDTVVKYDAPIRALQDTARSTGCVAGLTDNSGDTKLAGICHGDLYLCLVTERTEYSNFFKGTLMEIWR